MNINDYAKNIKLKCVPDNAATYMLKTMFLEGQCFESEIYK